MAWACEIVYRKSYDKSFLERMYPKLEKNIQFWEKKRKNGVLFHYDAAEVNRKKDTASVRCESGWDNSVRWDMDKPEQLWTIDLNCFMIMTYRSMDFIAKELGCYVDRNYCTNELSKVLTPASFMPLYIKTASKERAERCAKVAETKFAYGIPTTRSMKIITR